MIIKANPFPFSLMVFIGKILIWLLKRRFKKIVVHPMEETSLDSSYIFMSNHFSFLDGFIAGYLLKQELYDKGALKGVYIMVLEKQIQQNKWITKFGGFSVAPGTDSVKESLAYAAEILSQPGNVLLLYPQGKIESNHVDYINVRNGINEIVPQIKGSCQLLWSTNLVDYYEGIKPSLYCHLLNCGTNADFDFERLKNKINEHHTQALRKQIRFPKQ